jgi:hypothetical protein
MEGKEKQIRERVIGRQTRILYYWTFDVRQYIDFLVWRMEKEEVITNMYFQNNTINISHDNCDIQFINDFDDMCCVGIDFLKEHDKKFKEHEEKFNDFLKEREDFLKEHEDFLKERDKKLKENDEKIKELEKRFKL